MSGETDYGWQVTVDASDHELLRNAIKSVHEEYSADLYLYSASVDDRGYGNLRVELARLDENRKKRAILILVTNGGSANSAYQIATLFQKRYEEFFIYCPSRCKSAGSLIALGANTLFMDVDSELGPLDVQLIKQNELFARKSGLLSRSSFDALADAALSLYEHLMLNISLKSAGRISFKIASELSSTMAADLLSPIYGQMNPDVVGAEKRDLEVAIEYGNRLAERSRNAKPDAVQALVHNYPSHDFIIDDMEAQTLFRSVVKPSESLRELASQLRDFAFDEADPGVVFALSTLVEIGEDENGTPSADVVTEEAVAEQQCGSADRGSDQDAVGSFESGTRPAKATGTKKAATSNGSADSSGASSNE
jgi:hypothetical protein